MNRFAGISEPKLRFTAVNCGITANRATTDRRLKTVADYKNQQAQLRTEPFASANANHAIR